MPSTVEHFAVHEIMSFDMRAAENESITFRSGGQAKCDHEKFVKCRQSDSALTVYVLSILIKGSANLLSFRTTHLGES